MKNSFAFITSILILMGCGQNQAPVENPEVQATDSVAVSQSLADATANVDSLKQVIKTEEERIEGMLAGLRKVSLSTATMREQIKQKWNTVEVYYEGDNIVRVKTIPYENITKRTEEFYFKDGQLILAYTEDHGQESKEQPMGKAYFFNSGVEVAEVNNSKEKEYSVKNSDAERLLEEANEYLEIAKKK